MADHADMEFYLLEEKSEAEEDTSYSKRLTIANRETLTKDQSYLFTELCRVLDARKNTKNGNKVRKIQGGKAEDEQSLLEETLNDVSCSLFRSLWKERNIEDAFTLASLYWNRGLSTIKPVRRDVVRIRQALLRLKAHGITRFISVGCQTGCYEWFISNCPDASANPEVPAKPSESLLIEGIEDGQHANSESYIPRYAPHSQHVAKLFDHRYSQDKICLIFLNIDPDYYADYLKIPNVHRICAIERCDSSGEDYLSFVNSPVYGWDNVKDIAGEECYVAIFERMTERDEANWACSLNSLLCFCGGP